MRVITVKQPWAQLIVLGFKPVENRSRRTGHRGPLLIHAGVKPDIGDRANRALARWLPHVSIDALPFGQIIGSAELCDVIDTADAINGDAWWFTGPYGWLLRNARQFDRGFPTRGQLGLWRCPADIVAKIGMGTVSPISN